MSESGAGGATTATAFAPATVANVAVGFDLLGFAMDQAGDRVRVTRIPRRGEVRVRSITGVVTKLPSDPRKNTASVALLRMIEDLGLDFGFEVEIEKGIPLGSGMGGSAASAVGAVVAAAEVIARTAPTRPLLAREQLLAYALAGEAVASGSVHADNVAPCLYGGLTLALAPGAAPGAGTSHGAAHASPGIIELPVPAGVTCVLVHPHLVVETQAARAMLKPQLLLSEHVRQSANLAGFVAACYRGDLALVGRCLVDLVIEPQRSALIPGFDRAKARALAAGALGFSISGSGPSVFAWVEGESAAKRVAIEIVQAFRDAGVESDSWVAPISARGARIA